MNDVGLHNFCRGFTLCAIKRNYKPKTSFFNMILKGKSMKHIDFRKSFISLQKICEDKPRSAIQVNLIALTCIIFVSEQKLILKTKWKKKDYVYS